MYGSNSYGSVEYGGGADLLIVLSFLVNTKMTSIFTTQLSKAFLSNMVLTDIFSKTLTMIRAFSENIKLASTLVLTTARVFTSNIVMAASLNIMIPVEFISNIKLTAIFSKIVAFLKTFSENIKMKATIRLIMNGITVGRWKKQDKATTTWTKQSKQ